MCQILLYSINKAIDEITDKDIRNFYDELRCNNCENTVLHYHALLGNVFKYALKHEHIIKNPMILVTRPVKASSPASALKKDQVINVLKECTADRMYIVIQLAILFGMRRSELCGLKWSDIDFNPTEKLPYGTISVNRKILSRYGNGKEEIAVSTNLKTEKSRRTLPLSKEAHDILIKFKKQQDEWKKLCGNCWDKEWEGFICRDAEGKLITPNYISSHWRIIKRNLDFDVNFHGLRHTFATLQLKEGTELKFIQHWLGHSTIATTVNRSYGHICQSSYISI